MTWYGDEYGAVRPGALGLAMRPGLAKGPKLIPGETVPQAIGRHQALGMQFPGWGPQMGGAHAAPQQQYPAAMPWANFAAQTPSPVTPLDLITDRIAIQVADELSDPLEDIADEFEFSATGEEEEEEEFGWDDDEYGFAVPSYAKRDSGPVTLAPAFMGPSSAARDFFAWARRRVPDLSPEISGPMVQLEGQDARRILSRIRSAASDIADMGGTSARFRRTAFDEIVVTFGTAYGRKKKGKKGRPTSTGPRNPIRQGGVTAQGSYGPELGEGPTSFYGADHQPPAPPAPSVGQSIAIGAGIAVGFIGISLAFGALSRGLST